MKTIIAPLLLLAVSPLMGGGLDRADERERFRDNPPPGAQPGVLGMAACCATSLEKRQEATRSQPDRVTLKPGQFRQHVENFNRNDRETVVNHVPNAAALDWLAKNIPWFECPDAEIEEIYYFRWWTYRKLP